MDRKSIAIIGLRLMGLHMAATSLPGSSALFLHSISTIAKRGLGDQHLFETVFGMISMIMHLFGGFAIGLVLIFAAKPLTTLLVPREYRLIGQSEEPNEHWVKDVPGLIFLFVGLLSAIKYLPRSVVLLVSGDHIFEPSKIAGDFVLPFEYYFGTLVAVLLIVCGVYLINRRPRQGSLPLQSCGDMLDD